MATIELVPPTLPDEAVAARSPAPREGLADGARLLVVDNGKSKARELMLHIGDLLVERTGIASVEVYAKGSASRILERAEAAELAARSEAVIAGLGDCGACSACSLGDALRMEDAGVPSTVLISDVFVSHIASFSVTLGMPGYHQAVVPHPVSPKDDAQLARYAAGVVDQVATHLGG